MNIQYHGENEDNEYSREQQIKEIFSKDILSFEDKAKETCLRRILFSTRNKIDWQEAYRMALHDMPELGKYKAK